jgi:hypothetical protein
MNRFVLVFFTVMLMACNREEDRNIMYLFKGEVTTVTEFRREYETWLAASGRADGPEQRRNYLDTRVIEEILYSKGTLEGIEYLPDIKEKVAAYKRQLIVDKTRELIDREIYPFDEEYIKKHYAEHKDQYVRDKLYRLYAIRVKNKERAFEIYGTLAKQGESIRLLSARYSDDKRLANMNGDWGLFSEDVMDDSWKTAVPQKRVGDLVGPVRDGENYWTIIELAGFAYKRELSFERAYPLIVRELVRQSGDDKWRQYREKLLREYGVKVNENNLQWE